jgi:hypothetical protein
MLHCYPYVPVGGEMAVNCAILSYNGTVYFGFSGDAHAAPDLRRLETLLLTSFTELRNAVGITPKKQKVRRRRKVVAAAPPKTVDTPVSTAAVVSVVEPKRVPGVSPTTQHENPLAQYIVA